ncbi:MAG: riboflavin synthase [Syntrophales bacterium]|jgi:riboflavin synthase
MFTGIIQAVGTFRRWSARGTERQIEIETNLDLGDLQIGDSIAINGACLTVISKGNRLFVADVSPETLSRTNLDFLHPGETVNLEKSLRLNDFLGGHLVLGHVDGVGTIRDRSSQGNATIFGIEIDKTLDRYIVEKGSIAVDGISLTVTHCEKRRFHVSIIPLTAGKTTLIQRKVGDVVNIETDILGKYVEKLLMHSNGENAEPVKGGINMDFLSKYGFIK